MEDVYNALRNAHAAGDTESARVLSQYIRDFENGRSTISFPEAQGDDASFPPPGTMGEPTPPPVEPDWTQQASTSSKPHLGRTVLEQGLDASTLGSGSIVSDFLGSLIATPITQGLDIASYPAAFAEHYGYGRGETKSRMDRQMAERPVASILSGIGGSIATAPIAGAAGLLPKMTQGALLANMGKGAAYGAGAGAVYGGLKGTYEDDPVMGALQEGAKGAGMGAAFGGAFPAVAAGTGAALKGVGAVADKLPIASTIKNWGRDAYHAFSPIKPPPEKRAATAVEKAMVKTPEEAITAAQAPSEIGLTVAEKLGEPRILAMQKHADKITPEAQEAARVRASDQQRKALELVSPSGGESSPAVRGALEQRAAKLSQKVEASRDATLKKAQAAVEKMAPNASPAQSSILFKKQLEQAAEASQAKVNALWNRVENFDVPAKELRETFTNYVKSLPVADRQHISKEAALILDKRILRDKTSVTSFKELQAIRSNLLSDARKARSEGSHQKARILEEVSEIVLNAMDSSPFAQTGAYRAAREATKVHKEIYGQGDIGRILSSAKTGGDKVDENVALEVLLGGGGVGGRAGVQAIIRATGTPVKDGPVVDYILGQFQSKVVRDGQINIKQAKAFLERNKDILDDIPTIRNMINDAVASQGRYEQIVGRASVLENALYKKQSNALSRFTSGKVGQEFDGILAGKNPVADTRKLQSLVRNDPDAVDGLKNEASNYLLKVGLGSKIDEISGETVLSSSKMLGFLNNKNNAEKVKALRSVLGDDGIDRYKKIADELAKVEMAQRTKEAGKLIDDNVSLLISMAAKIGGGAAGRALGTKTLQAPQTISTKASEAVKYISKVGAENSEDVLIKALQDPKAFEALMAPRTTAAQKARADKLLNVWFSSQSGIHFRNMIEMDYDSGENEIPEEWK